MRNTAQQETETKMVSRKAQEDILEAFLTDAGAWRDRNEYMIPIFRSIGNEFSEKEAVLAEMTADACAWVISTALEAGRTIDSPYDVLLAVNGAMDKQVEKVIEQGLHLPHDVTAYYGYLWQQVSTAMREMETA